MVTHVIPLSQNIIRRPSFLSHPLAAAGSVLSSWRERARRRSDAALLRSLGSHMLDDIGVVLAEHHGPGARLQWHPAVLATTFTNRPRGNQEQ